MKKKLYMTIRKAVLACGVCLLIFCGFVGCASSGTNFGNQHGGEEVEAIAVESDTIKTEATYSKKAKSFAKKYKVSAELMGSLEEAMMQTEFPYSFEDMNGLEFTDDWAGGARYRVWHYDINEDKYYTILVYESHDAVSALYDITDGRKLIYAATDFAEEEEPEDGGILLVDGTAGGYGKEVTVGGDTYFWYMVPSGVYLAENQLKYGTLYVVSDDNSEDVLQTVQFTGAGDVAEIAVEEGTHIELSMQSEIILTPTGR